MLSIKGWATFQHYKDRRPVWIKLHTSLLTNRAFMTLGDRHKALLVQLWIVASDTNDGVLPPLEDVAFRLHMPSLTMEDLKPLIERDFIECSGVASELLAGGYQDASLEKSREEKSREEQSRGNALADTEPGAGRRAAPKPRKPEGRQAAEGFASRLVETWNRATKQKRTVLPKTSERIARALKAGYSEQQMLAAVIVAVARWKAKNGIPGSVHPHDVILHDGWTPGPDRRPLDWLDSYLRQAHDLGIPPGLCRLAREVGVADLLDTLGAWQDEFGERRAVADAPPSPPPAVAPVAPPAQATFDADALIAEAFAARPN